MDDRGPIERVRERVEAACAALDAARERLWGSLARVDRSIALLQKLGKANPGERPDDGSP